MQIFLSYARSDEAFAKDLSSQLTRRGLSVWSPDEEVLPGDNAWLQIGEALKRSRAMIVLVSPESMRSDHVRREIEYALGDPNYEHREAKYPGSSENLILSTLSTVLRW